MSPYDVLNTQSCIFILLSNHNTAKVGNTDYTLQDYYFVQPSITRYFLFVKMTGN